jgi:hypothetical protein
MPTSKHKSKHEGCETEGHLRLERLSEDMYLLHFAGGRYTLELSGYELVTKLTDHEELRARVKFQEHHRD